MIDLCMQCHEPLNEGRDACLAGLCEECSASRCEECEEELDYCTCEQTECHYVHVAYKSFLLADQQWSSELHRLFGKDAGTIRYRRQGEGEPGTALNRLYLEWEKAGMTWRFKAAAREMEG